MRCDSWSARLMELIDLLGVEIIAFDAAQFSLAQEAHLRYGKGRHPAGLNFGDCLSYAAAKSRGARLRYVGEGFARTDLA